MASTLLNNEYAAEILKREMNKEMIAAAEPVIKEALGEVEKVMRKKLASMVIAYLDNYIEVDRTGQTIRILVKHDHS